MSLRSRARFVQARLSIPFQQAQAAIRALGERTAEVSRSTGAPLKFADLVLIQEPLLRDQISAVVRRRPEITAFGLGVFDQERKPRSQVTREIQEGQEEMFEPEKLMNFLMCCEWIDQLERTKRPTDRHDSYGHKHRVERWQGAFRAVESHVSNGMMIAAAIHKGLEVRPTHPGSPNCHMNLSARSIAALDKEVEAIRRIWRLVEAAKSGRGAAFEIDGIPVVGPRGPSSVEALCGIKPSTFKALCASGRWETETGHAPFAPRPDVPTSTWFAPVESLECACRLWSERRRSTDSAA